MTGTERNNIYYSVFWAPIYIDAKPFLFAGEVKTKGMLDKYDEEIDGVKMDAFKIGASGEYNEEQEIKKQKDAIKVMKA